MLFTEDKKNRNLAHSPEDYVSIEPLIWQHSHLPNELEIDAGHEWQPVSFSRYDGNGYIGEKSES